MQSSGKVRRSLRIVGGFAVALVFSIACGVSPEALSVINQDSEDKAIGDNHVAVQCKGNVFQGTAEEVLENCRTASVNETEGGTLDCAGALVLDQVVDGCGDAKGCWRCGCPEEACKGPCDWCVLVCAIVCMH